MAKADLEVTVGLNVQRDQTIRELQSSLPWTIRYSRDYRANPQPHKDFTHALIHAGKALGKLLALADDMDHDREVADDPTLRERHAKYIADLVVCALRASNTFPGGAVDLQRAVEDRITTKNAPAESSATPACVYCRDTKIERGGRNGSRPCSICQRLKIPGHDRKPSTTCECGHCSAARRLAGCVLGGVDRRPNCDCLWCTRA